MENKAAKLTVQYRGPGEKGQETQAGITVSYGRDDVLVRIGNSMVPVNVEEFYMALDADDPIRHELAPAVIDVQQRRMAAIQEEK